ncbi:MAG: hypothetical protein VYE64_05305 [Planctomycetota bacterium]|nr:hypothetical protein [Planctomycetota bacterium]
MRNLPLLIVCLLMLAPSASFGQQIEATEGPGKYANYGEILITTSGWYNGVERFSNYYDSTTNKTGKVSINSGGVLRNRELTSSGADVRFENRAQFFVTDSGGAGVFNNDGFFLNSGNAGFFQNNGGTVNNSITGTIQNLAGLANSTQGLSNKSGKFVNQGTVINGLNGEVVSPDALFNNLSAGEFDNQKIFDNYAVANNHGQFNNQLDGVLTNYSPGTFTNMAGARIRNEGSLVNDGTFVNNGVINNNNASGTLVGRITNNGTWKGTSTVTGNMTDSGTMAVGNSVGSHVIDGDYFKVGGSKHVELAGLFDGGGDQSLTEYDWLEVTGDVELAGTLDVELMAGFELHRGYSFTTLRVGGTLTGQFDGLGEGDVVGNFGGQDLFISYVAGDGNDIGLFTNAVPEPNTALVWSLLAGLGLTVRRRR